MTERPADLAWALYSLAHAGCYDTFSAGPEYQTISDRAYRRSIERFADVLDETQAQTEVAEP